VDDCECAVGYEREMTGMILPARLHDSRNEMTQFRAAEARLQDIIEP
jgi:hypothetical protein